MIGAGSTPNALASSLTFAWNAASSANGSAAHTRSSSEQPSARSGFSGPEVQPFGHASAATGIGSAAAALVVSPPPSTVGALLSVAAALLATLTVIVIGGDAAPRASAALRVQRLGHRPLHGPPPPQGPRRPALRPGVLTSAPQP